jgi:hypothetical protein
VRLPLPFLGSWLTTMWRRFGDWSNVTIYERGKLEIRKLDILLLILGCSLAIFYWVFYSWQWAVLGTLFYIMVLMMVLWMF